MEKITEIKNKWGSFIAFGIIFGVIVHGMIIFNDLPNSDGILFNYYKWQNTLTVGRWFLGIAALISGTYTIPVVNGVISIIFITLSGILIISIFDIKTTINRTLILSFMLSFPAFATAMLYMFTVDAYSISIFLSVLAVWLLHKESSYLSCIKAALCITFSMGIYQAYLSVTMTLCMMYLIKMILSNKDNITKMVIKFLTSGLIGTVLYFIILKIALKATGLELSSYQGINGVGNKFGLTELIVRIKTIYVQFIITLINKLFISKIFLLIFVVVILIIVFEILVKYNYRIVLKIGLCLVVLPICLLPIYLTSTDVDYYLIMKYAWVLLFVYPLVLMERLNIGYIYNNIITMLSIIIIGSFIISNNSAYEYASLRYDRTLMLANRIENQLEIVEYDLSKPIGIFYEGYNDEKYKIISQIYPYMQRKYISILAYNVETFMKQYFTSEFKYIKNDEEYWKIKDSQEYKKIKLDKKSFKIVETKKYIIVKVRAGVDEYESK